MGYLDKWPPELGMKFGTNTTLLTNLSKTDYSKLEPKKELVLEAFKRTAYDDVKVLIIGQDPYINGEAHGLAFSSQTEITPSLRIIFKELKEDVGVQQRSTNLSDWADQGVFLLNTILTTYRKTSLAHEHYGWQSFTSQAIRLLLKRKKPLVAMLWGNYAKEVFAAASKDLDLSNVFILKAYHPAAETRPGGKKFSGCKHFSKANQWLEQKGLEPIKW